MLVGSTLLALIGGVLVFVHDMFRTRLLHVALMNGEPLELPDLLLGEKFHVFISYTWSSGQDQARTSVPCPTPPAVSSHNQCTSCLSFEPACPLVLQVRGIKTLLQEVLPGVRIFLE